MWRSQPSNIYYVGFYSGDKYEIEKHWRIQNGRQTQDFFSMPCLPK